jgi:hypothetical protein
MSMRVVDCVALQSWLIIWILGIGTLVYGFAAHHLEHHHILEFIMLLCQNNLDSSMILCSWVSQFLKQQHSVVFGCSVLHTKSPFLHTCNDPLKFGGIMCQYHLNHITDELVNLYDAELYLNNI